jgi:hypothetical protein
LVLTLFLLAIGGILVACEEHHCVQEATSEALCTTATPLSTISSTPTTENVVETAKSFVGRFQWEPLDYVDCKRDDFWWCLKHGTKVDSDAQNARMNCWEMILLAAHEAGKLEQNAVYVEGSSDCLYCDGPRLYSRVEDYLGYDDALLIYAIDERELPKNLKFVGGEIVFFNKLDWHDGHVAIATGDEDKVISLWYGLNGTRSVQETSVREIMEWKGKLIEAVKVGYPRWWP